MQNYLFQSDVKPYVLFGSSFPRDKDYTQVQHENVVIVAHYIPMVPMVYVDEQSRQNVTLATVLFISNQICAHRLNICGRPIQYSMFMYVYVCV